MNDHRSVLAQNVVEVAAVRRDAMDALDAIQAHILANGPLRLDGTPNEQLLSQLRGLARIAHEVADRTAEMVSVLDQINRVRGRLEEAGESLPDLPGGLGPSVRPPPTDPASIPVLESDLLRQLKAERDAALARLAAVDGARPST